MATTNGPGVAERPDSKTVRKIRRERREAAREESIRQRSNHDKTLIEFQPDAVELEKRSVPGGARWTLYTVVAFLIATVAWACWAEVEKIVVANGKLVPVDMPTVVQSPTNAPIQQMHAQFGDRVKAGDLLVTLDPTFPEADLNALNARLEGFEVSIARLTAEQEKKEFVIPAAERTNPDWILEQTVWLERQDEYNAKMNELASEQNKLEVQLQNNEENIRSRKEDVANRETVVNRFEALGQRKSMSEIQVLSQQMQLRSARLELQTAISRRSELETEMDALAKRKLAFIASWRSKVAGELLQKHQERKSLVQEINKARKMNEFVEIRVPTNTGYDEFEVLEVADRTIGSVLKSGEPLFKLMPVGSPLEAEVEIQGKDIGLIKEGSPVSIKLAAFPYQEHGTLDGVVRSISEDAFERETPQGPVATFLARVEIKNPDQLTDISASRLSAGMTSAAEIKVGKRQVIKYFLYPLIRSWDESLREP